MDNLRKIPKAMVPTSPFFAPKVELETGASGIKTLQECAKALCSYYDEEYGEGVVFYDNFYLGEFDLVD